VFLNLDQSVVRERMAALDGQADFYARVRDIMQAHPAPFLVAPDRAGLDFGVENKVAEHANRARVKIFPLAGAKFAVFFYKPSLLTWSRDRFGYGGRVFEPGKVTDMEIRSWLDFVAEGLPPERRPADLMRGFPYDVPN
jgi:hypothetical protein